MYLYILCLCILFILSDYIESEYVYDLFENYL